MSNIFQITLIKKIKTVLFYIFCAFLVVIFFLWITVLSLPSLQKHIEEYFYNSMSLNLKMQNMNVSWHTFNPRLSMKELSLTPVNESQSSIQLHRVQLELDMLSSLFSWELVFNFIDIQRSQFSFQVDQNDQVYLLNQKIYSVSSNHNMAASFRRLALWLKQQGYINLLQTSLKIYGYKRTDVTINMPYLLKKPSSDFSQQTLKSLLNFKQSSLHISAHQINQNNWQGVFDLKKIDMIAMCSHFKICTSSELKGFLHLTSDWSLKSNLLTVDGKASLLFEDKGLNAELNSDVKLTASFSDSLIEWQNNYHNNILTLNDKQYLISPVVVKYLSAPSSQLIIDTKQLDLSLITELANTNINNLLPHNTRNILKQLNLQGYWNDLHVIYYLNKQLYPKNFLSITSNVDKMSINSWQDIPSAKNISGQLTASPFEGSLKLDSKNFSFGLSEIFQNKWLYYDKANLLMSWKMGVDESFAVNVKNVEFTKDKSIVTGNVKFNIPHIVTDKNPAVMDLNLMINYADEKTARQYLPVYSLDEDFVKWFDSGLSDFDISDGRLSMKGPITGCDPLIWKLALNINHGIVNYDKKWPELKQISGKLLANNDEVKIDIDKAKIWQSDFTSLEVKVDLNKELAVDLRTDLAVKGKDLERLGIETPLATLHSDFLYKISGDFLGNMKLYLPLSDIKSNQVHVDLLTHDAMVDLTSINLKIDKITGQFIYDSKFGMTANKVTASLLERDVLVDIRSKINKHNKLTTYVDWSGKIDMDHLQRWLGTELSILSGETNYSGSLNLIGDKHLNIGLKISSDLVGVSLDLPDQFALDGSTKAPFDFTMTEGVGKKLITTKLADLAQMKAFVDKNHRLSGLNLYLGKGVVPEKVRKDMVTVSGKIANLNIIPWIDRFQHYWLPHSNNKFSNIELKNLSVKRLMYDAHRLSNVILNSKLDEGNAEILIESDQLIGSVFFPRNVSYPWRIKLKELHLPSVNLSSMTTRDALKLIDPKILPSANVEVDSLYVGEKKYGKLSFSSAPLLEGKRFKNIQLKLDNTSITGSINWLYKQGRHHSYVSIESTSSLLSELQGILSLSELVKAKSANFSGDFYWEGSPLSFNLKKVIGKSKFYIKKGILYKLNTRKAIPLKLLGVLNIEALRKRLQLDFSDVFSSGVSFDKVSGSLGYSEGLVSIIKPFKMIGSTVNTELSGSMYLGKKPQLNLELLVAVPVTANLSFLSMLLGNLPFGGFLWLVNKTVGGKLDPNVRYKITGDMDNPLILNTSNK